MDTIKTLGQKMAICCSIWKMRHEAWSSRTRTLLACAHLFDFECNNGVLVVRGCVPTFYLKQVLQTLLKGLEGVRRIDNQVQVDASEGVFEPTGPAALC